MRALLVVVMLGAVAAAAPADSPAIPVLQKAMASEKDAQALAAALGEVDALIAKTPKDPIAHYARGWILSHSGKDADAVIEYDKAFAIDKTLADAAYNAGVVLQGQGKKKEALAHFDKALAADPKHVDAAYNAGQGYYDQKDFAKAAARWETAAALAPEDFGSAKKVVQAYVALGKADKAKAAREKVFALWKAGKVPGNAKSYVYDQFDVGKYHVYVYETFDVSGDLAYVYAAKATLADKPVGSVNLETSAVIREQGVPFVIGIDKDGKHETLSQNAYKQQPDYATFRAIAKKLIAERF